MAVHSNLLSMIQLMKNMWRGIGLIFLSDYLGLNVECL